MDPSKLIYSVTPHWAIMTFIKVLDAMLFEYRNKRYTEERIMKKVMAKLYQEAHGSASGLNSDDNQSASLSSGRKTSRLGKTSPKSTKKIITAPAVKRLGTMISKAPNNKSMMSPKNSSRSKIKVPNYSWAEDDFAFENSLRHKKLWVDSLFIYALEWAFGSILKTEAK